MVLDLVDFDICRRYCIRFWGTRYDINPIMSINIVADILDIDDIHTNHWPEPKLILRF